jgi:hypothetical protein
VLLLRGSGAVIPLGCLRLLHRLVIQTNRLMQQPKMPRIAPYKGTTCNSPATVQGAYAVYGEWRAVRHSQMNAKKAARLFGVKIKECRAPVCRANRP